MFLVLIPLVVFGLKVVGWKGGFNGVVDDSNLAVGRAVLGVKIRVFGQCKKPVFFRNVLDS